MGKSTRRLGIRARQFVKWLAAHENGGRLPRTIKQAMREAGVPSGSMGYARQQIIDSGTVKFFSYHGHWGFQIRGRVEVLPPIEKVVRPARLLPKKRVRERPPTVLFDGRSDVPKPPSQIKRRCQACKKIFESTYLEEYACPSCTTGRTTYAEIREAILP